MKRIQKVWPGENGALMIRFSDRTEAAYALTGFAAYDELRRAVRQLAPCYPRRPDPVPKRKPKT